MRICGIEITVIRFLKRMHYKIMLKPLKREDFRGEFIALDARQELIIRSKFRVGFCLLTH